MVAQLNPDFRFTHEGVMRPNTHSEAKRNFGKFLSNPAKTYDSECFSFDLKAPFGFLFQFFEIAAYCQFAVAALKHAGQGENMSGGKFRHGTGGCLGGIEYLNAFALGVFNVNII